MSWSKFLLTAIFIAFLYSTSSAYWPVTVEENLPIANDPELGELYCSAHSSIDDKIIVTYFTQNIGTCYQIIDKYGELLLPSHELLCPGLSFFQNSGIPESIPDGEGGIIVCWATPYSSFPGIYAQRIDSLGNRLWGDDGVRIFPVFENDLDICTDGEGGFYLAVVLDSPGGAFGNFNVQRVTSDGSVMFGDSGLVVIYTPEGLRCPLICSDGENGCFIAWEDFRPPYQGIGASFLQHLDENCNPLWANDLYICQDTWSQWNKMISDGAGGVIFQAVGLADYNIHYRIDGNGNILWERDYLSWWYWGRMMPGEPGFFYLCFNYDDGLYAQRVDMEGNNYWPTWGSGQVGALLYQLQTGLSLWPDTAMNLFYT